MADDPRSETVNSGGTGEPRHEQAQEREFAIEGNAKVKGDRPSPSDRERGETSSSEAVAPVSKDV